MRFEGPVVTVAFEMEEEPSSKADHGSAGQAEVIRTPDQRLRVFVSSTLGELAEERAAVRGAIEQVRLVPVMFETGAHAHPPRPLYRAYLEQSHVFIGIYWQSYGSVAPDMGVSGIEDEYDVSAGKPALVYIKSPAPEREERMEELLRRIQGDDRVAYKHFETADELAGLVADDLALLLTERFEESRPRPEGAAGAASVGRAIPVPPTSLIGREAELVEICDLLVRENVRLVTLTGVGGVGKTRLALEAARRSAAGFPEGVSYVDLSPVTEPGLVPITVAAAVGVPEQGTRPATDSIIDQLADARALLVLDNFEQLLDAAPFVSELLAGCPGMKALVTSRALLRLRGEHEHAVMPLNAPPRDQELELAALAGCSAVRLFAERAEEIDPSFELNEATAGDVAELCRRLDGIPLAIELAAARVLILPPRSLLTRIGDRLDLLSGAVDLPERQRTLRATLDWSHDLLDDQEQALFARLSVFAGGFTLEAAQEVCSSSDELTDVLEPLASLIAKSMVISQPRPGAEPRFRMLETVRAYADERLQSRGEAETTERRFADYCIRFAERVGKGLLTAEHTASLEVLDVELDNLRAATVRAVARHDLVTLMAVQVPIWIHTWVRGGIGWLRPLMEAAYTMQGPLDPELRAKLLWGVAGCRFECGDSDPAIPVFRELIELQRQRDDEYWVALASAMLASALPYEQASEARSLIGQAIATLRRIGDPYTLALALMTLGALAMRGGDPASAEHIHHEMLERARAVGSDQMIGHAVNQLGVDALARGEIALARERFAKSAAIHRHIRSLEGLAYTLDGLAGVALTQGNLDAAAVALGASQAMRERIGISQVWPLFRPITQALIDAVRDALGEQRYEALHHKGMQLRSEEAIDRALAATDPAQVPAAAT